MDASEVKQRKKHGYCPKDYYENNPSLKNALDFLKVGFGGKSFKDLAELFINTDTYMALADFADYQKAQNDISRLYFDKMLWQKMSLINIANAGIFSADRSVKEYAENIWGVKPLK